MKAIIRRNSANIVKSTPTIIITKFNGVFSYSYFELQVNGIDITVRTQDHSDGTAILFGFDDDGIEITTTYQDEITHYILHFINGKYGGAFDKPLSISGPTIINNIQYEILSQEEVHGKKVLKLLVNGAFATVEKTAGSKKPRLKCDANIRFLTEHKEDILCFANKMFGDDGEDAVNE